jgi:hypothetical protein
VCGGLARRVNGVAQEHCLKLMDMFDLILLVLKCLQWENSPSQKQDIKWLTVSRELTEFLET